MNPALDHIRRRLRQNPWARRLGWILLVLGAVQVPFSIIVALFDSQEPAGVKTANILVGLWVLGLGIAIVLFIRSGQNGASAAQPEHSQGRPEQLELVRKVYAGYCVGCLIVGVVLVLLGLTVGPIFLVAVGFSLGVAASVMGIRYRQLSRTKREDAPPM